MSQLIQVAVDAIAYDHPLFPDLMVAIRNRHLRLVVERVRPGGLGIFVLDMTSITLEPGAGQRPPDRRVANVAEDDHDKLKRLMFEFDREKNFFHGHSPSRVQAELSQLRLSVDDKLPAVEQVELLEPWKWTFNEGRQYLVYAVRFRRRNKTSFDLGYTTEISPA